MFVTIINGQNKTVVSVANGDYWIYVIFSRDNGLRSTKMNIKKVIGDTVITHKNCKKIESITYDGTNQKYSYEIWYSDDKVFSKYNGTELINYYDSRIIKDTTVYSGYVPTQGDVSHGIHLGSRFIFDDVYKTEEYWSSTNRGQSSTVYSEKYGFIDSDGYYNYGASYEGSTLIGAKIDGIYYGKPAPLLITSYNISNRTIEINFELPNNNQQFNKIIIYRYNSIEYKYVVFDSVKTSVPQLNYTLYAGDYDLRFSYKTNSDLESELSNNIVFSVAPESFKLFHNYPNPFNGHTKIPFETTLYPIEIDLVISNVLGQTIYKNSMITDKKGYYEFDVNLNRFASGVYFYRISNKFGLSQLNKMILIN